ncbi:MAG: hypothetical protein AB1298_08400 [Bacteroidota bacterium]
MTSPAVNTVLKMLESLPVNEQNRVVDHIQEYILDLQDEQQWDKEFRESQKQLIATAKRARQQIVSGHAKSLNISDL